MTGVQTCALPIYGCVQVSKEFEKDKHTILECVFIVIFELADEAESDQLFQKAMNLQSDKDFNFCREIGGKQAILFLQIKKEPMGLSHLLFNHPLDKIYS